MGRIAVLENLLVHLLADVANRWLETNVFRKLLETKPWLGGLVAALCLLQTESLAQLQIPPPIPGVPPGRLTDTIPSHAYFLGMERLYRGDYRDADRHLRREVRSAIKIGATQRWIDSICYHAMWGEVLYHSGNLELALEQYDQACSIFLLYPKWMMQVDFRQQPRADTNRARRQPLWGTSTRQFTLGSLPGQMMMQIGDFQSAARAAQQGGAMVAPQFWQVNGIEVIRCMTIAIQRRNELLGPLAAHDPISRQVIRELSAGVATPNHWSNAWADLQLGVAYAGDGKLEQAAQALQRAERLQGRFDHPLTGLALLEQGRVAMQAGKFDIAEKLFLEASYSAFYYDDIGTIDEAFRLASMVRLARGPQTISPVWEPAAAWARQQRYGHIMARVHAAMAEEQLLAGNSAAANVTLRGGQPRITGLLGNWNQYLEARILLDQGRDTNAVLTQLIAAIQEQVTLSPRTLQLQLTNLWFDEQRLRASAADEIYRGLLGDPTPVDWGLRPLQTLALLKTPRDASFDRWLIALEERRDRAAAIEVTDLAKRNRYFNSLVLGGRLASLRNLLEAPQETLTLEARGQRHDLLLRYPQYAQALRTGDQLHANLKNAWQVRMEGDDEKSLNRLWQEWSENLNYRQTMALQLGSGRVPGDFQFPPVLPVSDLQAQLAPGQAVAIFHNTAGGLRGFLITDTASTSWNCGPAGDINRPLMQFLRDIGSYDRNYALDDKTLASTDWHDSGKQLFDALFDGSSIDCTSMTELIVVPDDLVWYVPFEALPANPEDPKATLISLSRVRVVPTMGLAFGQSIPLRRIRQSALVGDGIAPGDKAEDRQAAIAPLAEVIKRRVEFPQNPTIPAPQMASLLDMAVVLNEVEIDLADPLGWTPIPASKLNNQGTLGNWLGIPLTGPQRMVFGGTYTIAENGGRVSRRRTVQHAPGTELFLASCGLMSVGNQTILLSRWRVGGQSTMDLLREFLQELPHIPAAEAWQRCVQVAWELPLQPALEPRLKLSNTATPPTAAHPLFWAGYLLVDSGAQGDNDVEDEHAARMLPDLHLAEENTARP